MPVLHEYMDKGGYYILANINGNVVAFQLKTGGHEKLRDAGIEVGQTFSRFLLIDLYKKGDAYTHKSGVIPPEFQQRKGEQLEIEFPPEPEAEKLFPRCSNCSSMKDLHLIELLGPQRSAKILCPDCRAHNRKSIDSSIPFQFLTRSSLKHFLAKSQFEIIDPAVADYQKLLEMEFEDKWLQLKRKKKPVQDTLLGEKPDDSLF
jgi:hypothetical protein